MLLQKLHGKGLEIFLCLLNNGRLSCSEVIRKMVHNSGSADEPNKVCDFLEPQKTSVGIEPRLL